MVTYRNTDKKLYDNKSLEDPPPLTIYLLVKIASWMFY